MFASPSKLDIGYCPEEDYFFSFLVSPTMSLLKTVMSAGLKYAWQISESIKDDK